MNSVLSVSFLCFAAFLSVANGDECGQCYQDRKLEDYDSQVPRMGSISLSCADFDDMYNDRKEELENNRHACVEFQLLGFQAGCCTAVNSETGCPICADYSEPAEGYVVPTDGSEDRNPEDCAEGWAYQRYAHNGIQIAGNCQDTRLQRAGFYCGCPNAYQESWLCPTKEKPRRPKRGDFYRFEKCGATEFLISLYKAGEIVDVARDFGFDYPAWCECPGVSLNNDFNCEFCKDGTAIKEGFHDQIFNTNTKNVRDPNGKWDYRRTCAQAADYARYVTRDDVCEGALAEARLFCCPASALGMYLSVMATGALLVYNLFF